jgi:hypothetical protein
LGLLGEFGVIVVGLSPTAKLPDTVPGRGMRWSQLKPSNAGLDDPRSASRAPLVRNKSGVA